QRRKCENESRRGRFGRSHLSAPSAVNLWRGGAMAKDVKVKTNAMRALDARGIAYAVATYPDTIHSAAEVAPLLGVPSGHVFKTLVVLAEPGDRRLLVVTPGDREIDLRLLARGVGAKSAHMALQRDAERLTGLRVGGISPLALLDKRFEVYLD